jgi:preprotein translocase subunit YajC
MIEISINNDYKVFKYFYSFNVFIHLFIIVFVLIFFLFWTLQKKREREKIDKKS